MVFDKDVIKGEEKGGNVKYYLDKPGHEDTKENKNKKCSKMN